MSSDNCPNLAQNSRKCSCTYPGCPRHGLCCECLHYHRQAGELPGCYFSSEAEKTYDRSISFFVQSRRG